MEGDVGFKSTLFFPLGALEADGRGNGSVMLSAAILKLCLCLLVALRVSFLSPV